MHSISRGLPMSPAPVRQVATLGTLTVGSAQRHRPLGSANTRKVTFQREGDWIVLIVWTTLQPPSDMDGQSAWVATWLMHLDARKSTAGQLVGVGKRRQEHMGRPRELGRHPDGRRASVGRGLPLAGRGDVKPLRNIGPRLSGLALRLEPLWRVSATDRLGLLTGMQQRRVHDVGLRGAGRIRVLR